MLRRFFIALLTLAVSAVASAQAQTPDALVKQLGDDVLAALKADRAIKSGDLQGVIALVDTKVMPHVDVQRMTSAAVGRYWRQASPEQQQSLQEQFKLLLIRTYSGALTQVSDQSIDVKPLRDSGDDGDVIVKTEIRGSGEPAELDYRLEKNGTGWKIYDLSVLGVWLAENYRNTFAEEIGTSGIDGLIAKLTERNRTLRAR